MNPHQIQQSIETLKELKEQFDQLGDEYTDISMAIHYLSDPEYYETNLPKPSKENHHEYRLGSIGETEVKVVAEGPKAQWCADVVGGKSAVVFDDVQREVDGFIDEFEKNE